MLLLVLFFQFILLYKASSKPLKKSTITDFRNNLVILFMVYLMFQYINQRLPVLAALVLCIFIFMFLSINSVKVGYATGAILLILSMFVLIYGNEHKAEYIVNVVYFVVSVTLIRDVFTGRILRALKNIKKHF